MTGNNWKFKVLYDGSCPKCVAEIAWFMSRNKGGYLIKEDISEDTFDASQYGKTMHELMVSIHGVYPDGRLVSGVDAIAELFTAVGLGWLWKPAKWTLTRPLFKLGYWFATMRRRRKFRNGEICESGTCSI